MNVGRSDHGVAVIGTKLYAVGGFNGFDYDGTTEEFDTITNSGWGNKSSLFYSRARLAVSAVGSRIYAIGGFGSIADFQLVEEYTQSSNTWTRRKNIPTGRSAHAVGNIGGRLYVVGGDGATQASNEEFTPPDPTVGTVYVHRKN
jgi:kelch-like protein 17 (actinfilin)